MNRWDEYLRPRATVRHLLLLGVCCLAVNAGLLWWSETISSNQRLLDVQFLYSPLQANQYLDLIGAAGRQRYLWLLLSIDLLYPVLYAVWLSLVLILVDKTRERSFLLAIPLTAAFFDWCENVSLAMLIGCFVKDEPVELARFSAIFTLLKWAAVGLCGVAVVAGYLRCYFCQLPVKGPGP